MMDELQGVYDFWMAPGSTGQTRIQELADWLYNSYHLHNDTHYNFRHIMDGIRAFAKDHEYRLGSTRMLSDLGYLTNDDGWFIFHSTPVQIAPRRGE